MTENDYRSLVDERLERFFVRESTHPLLAEAMRYSIEAGGKRIRPLLNLMANAMLDGDTLECLDLACAIEMIHTYSLIHDDLPAMDNDEMRRGRPTSHVVFGEAFAVLAGDGLLSDAFAVMIDNALQYGAHADRHLRAMQAVARGAGADGMLTGQSADLESEGQILTEGELRFIHVHKTGDMITASLTSGAILAGASEIEVGHVRNFGEHLGIAFQIIDDVLDVEGSEADLGKTPGKDRKAAKFTFPTLFGIDTSRQMAAENTQQAISALTPFGKSAEPLCDLARRMLRRQT